MTHRRIIRTLVVLAGSLLVAGGGYAMAARQATPPRPTSEQMGKVSLGEVGLAAGNASVTKFTYTPGMAMTPHTHTGRTSIITVVQGNLTESRGETKRVYGPGSVIMVSEGTTHANENDGPETLIYTEVNITGTVPGPARAGTPPTK